MMYLDTFELDHAEVGYGQVGLQGNLGYEDKQVRVKGQVYKHALSSHPPARLRYRLNGGYTNFECHVGINDDVGQVRTHADFLVLADGRQVAAVSRVRAGEAPRYLNANVSGVRKLELIVQTNRWEYCHAVWLDPRLETHEAEFDEAPQSTPDCLQRTMITVPRELPRAERCIATVVSPGYEHLLDDMLGSLYANGQCQDALVVVFSVGENSLCERVIEKYGATIIRCQPHNHVNPTVKAALYSVAQFVKASSFLCLDADTLILDDLRPLFFALEALPPQTILACREGNGHGYQDLNHVLVTAYGGKSSDIRQLLGSSGQEGAYSLVVNDGVFAGSRGALLALDNAIRAMDRAPAWVDANPNIGWRNQFIFNLALAHLDCGLELDPTNNIQLHVQEVTLSWNGSIMQAHWHGQKVRLLHFSGNGRLKYPQWRGLFADKKQKPVAGTTDGDAYARFLSALRTWLGRNGSEVLAWSFYGTADGKSASVRDASTFPLFALLHYLVRANGCIRILETGTARGVSTACLASAVAHRTDGRVVTMDINPLPQRLELWASLNQNLQDCIEQRVGDSLEGMQLAINDGERYDGALLDSLHSAEHVWAEFELASQLVCPGGLIMIHDAKLQYGTVEGALQLIQAAGYGVTRLLTAECGIAEDDGLGLAIIENRCYSKTGS